MPAVTVASTPDSSERVRGDERGVSGEQRDRDAHLGVRRALADLGDRPAHHEPDRDPAGGRQDEVERRVGEREAAGHDGGHGHAVGHERGRVVEEPLALDRAHDPPRHLEAAQDRRGRERVRGRHDRAQHERRLPGHAGHERVRGPRHRAHGQQHEPDRAERHRAQVGPQEAEVGEDRRRVEERWEEDHQHHLGIQRHVGQAGDEPEQRAAHDQHDRVRDRHGPGERAEPGHGHQQSGDQELGFAHGRIIAPIARAKPILLAAAMAFLALNVWTGSPLLAVWLGSRVQGDESQPSMAAYAVVIGSLIFFSWGLYQLLKLTMAAYQEATGTTPTVRSHAPWLRSMRGERPNYDGSHGPHIRRRAGGGRDGPDRRRRLRDLVLLLQRLVDRRRLRALTYPLQTTRPGSSAG